MHFTEADADVPCIDAVAVSHLPQPYPRTGVEHPFTGMSLPSDPFFTALDRDGADDFSGCARQSGDLLQRGGYFPDGGERSRT